MINLSVPEINLISIYADNTKLETVDNIILAIPDFTEREMVKIAERCIDKLDLMTDEQFAEFNFSEQFADEYADEYV